MVSKNYKIGLDPVHLKPHNTARMVGKQPRKTTQTVVPYGANPEDTRHDSARNKRITGHYGMSLGAPWAQVSIKNGPNTPWAQEGEK